MWCRHSAAYNICLHFCCLLKLQAVTCPIGIPVPKAGCQIARCRSSYRRSSFCRAASLASTPNELHLVVSIDMLFCCRVLHPLPPPAIPSHVADMTRVVAAAGFLPFSAISYHLHTYPLVCGQVHLMQDLLQGSFPSRPSTSNCTTSLPPFGATRCTLCGASCSSFSSS